MDEVFDRDTFLKNLQSVMEQKNVKANELEAAVGVYSGYISRIKGDATKLPALDVVWKMAKYLHVNLSWLLEGSAEHSVENQEYLHLFIKRLFDQTKLGNLDWRPQDISKINAALMDKIKIFDMPFITTNPMSQRSEFVSGIDEEQGVFHASGLRCGFNRITSFSQPNEAAYVSDTAFTADIGSGRTICLVPLQAEFDFVDYYGNYNGSDIRSWYELLVEERNAETKINLICSNNDSDNPLSDDLKMLYRELKQHEHELRVEKNVRGIIDDFMAKTEPVVEEPMSNNELQGLI